MAGFTRLVPTLVFAVAIVASMAYGVVALGESLGVLRLLCLVAIVAGVVGLKLVS